MLPITTLWSMYKLYNRNPEGDKLPDCVCRAISLATGADYRDVERLLRLNGNSNDCEELCVKCYSQMLDEVGFPQIDAEGKTVGQLAEEHPNDTILVRIEGHLTCCINGNCYDIWDCTGKQADIYWLVLD